MAVEIPVIVDIEGAFQDAVSRVGAAIKPLERAVSDEALSVKVGVIMEGDEEVEIFLRDIKDRGLSAAGQLSGAIENVNKQLLAATQTGDKAKFTALLEAKHYLEDMATAAQRSMAELDGLANTMQGLNARLSSANLALSTSSINSQQWKDAAKEVRTVSDEIAKVNQRIAELGTKSGSIDRINLKMQELSAKWNAMSAAQKYDTSGNLKASAAKVVAQYKKQAELLERQGKTLQQIIGEERKRADAIQRSTDKLKHENTILSSTQKTMRILQEQERILSARLSSSTIGTKKYEDLKNQLQAVRAEILKIDADISGKVSPALSTTGSRMASILKSSIALFALHSSARFVKNIREVTAEFELQRVALGSIIQDTERADRLFTQIKSAAIESPFQIKDLVSYTKQLSAYQIETEKLFDTTMKLADVSAGLGVDMGRLILAYGQVRAASVLRGQELRQFTEAGVPLVDKLAEKFSELRGEMVTTGEVFQLISERAVPFKMIEEIFDDMTSAGGLFYKMQEKQAKTLAGQWANLKDAVSIMYDEIGNTDTVHRAMESLIRDARSLMLNWRTWGSAVAIVGSALLSYVAVAKAVQMWTRLVEKAELAAMAAESAREKGFKRLITGLAGKAAAEKISAVATKYHTRAIIRATFAANTFSATLWNLWAALLANPFGLVAVAVSGIIALFTTLGKKTRDVQKDLQAASESITALNKAKKDTAELIDSYEELSKKTALTAEESKKLRDISRELAQAFPRANKGIDEQTGALTLNIAKLREYNKEAQDAIEKGMAAQIEVNKKSIKDNQKEIDKLIADNTKGSAHQMKWWAPWSPLIRTGISDEQMAENAEKIAKLTEENKQLAKSNEDLTNSLNGVNQESEDSGERLLSWQDKLIKFNSRVDKEGKRIVTLSEDQIKGYNKLDDALEEIAKKYNEETATIKVLEAALVGKNEEEAKDIKLAIERAEARRDLAKEELDYYNSFFLTQKKGGGGHTSYTQDPFIKQMQERMKFMKDFQKGYEDLGQFMSKSSALGKESETMLTRGLSIGLGADEQKRAAEDLSKWYEDTINSTFDYLKKNKGVTGSLQDFLSRQITGSSNRDKMLKDFQSLLQSLFDAKTDFDTNQLKKDMEEALKRVSDELKRSETARNFYQNILDLTGDEQLAATMGISVYGDIGGSFKKQMQQQLNAALNSLDPGALTDELREAFAGQDFNTIMKYLDKFPEEWRKRLKEMAADDQKFNADRINNLLKALQSAKTYGQKRVELAKQTSKRVAEIEALDVPKSVKDDLKLQNTKKEAEEAQKLQYEAFKETPLYVEMFADLDAASSRMLRNMRGQLESMKANWKDLPAKDIKEMQSRIAELDKQLSKRNPFKELTTAMREYRDLTKTQSRKEADTTSVGLSQYAELQKASLEAAREDLRIAEEKYGVGSEEWRLAKDALDVQAEETDLAIEQAEVAQDTATQYRQIKQHIIDAAEGLQEWSKYLSDSLSAASEIVETFGSADTSDMFNTIASGVTKTVGGAASLAVGIATGNVSSIVKGTADVITGIFGTIKEVNIKRINKQIEEQDNIIKDLEDSYDRLENAMAKSFGSDYIYNYNKQLDILLAKQQAYEEQARLEGEKGKKADEDKIRDYTDAAKAAEDQIAEMKTQLSEFFSGTDLTSAAEDFASAWIEAYKEFGSVTDAMGEKFNDMVENMINKSLSAKIMQEMLEPVFNQIDTMAKDGLLSTEDIAAIAALAEERIPMINDAMTNLMTSLASAGLDVRQSTSGFKGISKDYATASEESILGLAAAVNTQNYYISYVPTISENVAAILSAMTGGANPTANPATDENGDIIPSVQQMVYNHLPNMDQNLAEMLRLFRSVITTKNASTNTAYIAVK